MAPGAMAVEHSEEEQVGVEQSRIRAGGPRHRVFRRRFDRRCGRRRVHRRLAGSGWRRAELEIGAPRKYRSEEPDHKENDDRRTDHPGEPPHGCLLLHRQGFAAARLRSWAARELLAEVPTGGLEKRQALAGWPRGASQTIRRRSTIPRRSPGTRTGWRRRPASGRSRGPTRAPT